MKALYIIFIVFGGLILSFINPLIGCVMGVITGIILAIVFVRYILEPEEDKDS